jgi:hypothetical protein
MLYSVSQIVATELALRGCPLRVVYGPERFSDVGFTDARIVFERPRESGDVVGPPRSSKGNPPRRAERGIAGVVRVYAHSTVDGARVQDHEGQAEQAVDLLIVALQIAAARSVTTLSIGAGGYLSAQALEVDGLEAWPGVVYELAITVQRAVFDRTWAGDAKSTTDTYSMTVSGTCVTTAVPTP